jgi:hypothetical protein
MIWEFWKKSFDLWEDATARYAERFIESPLVLGPSGQMLKIGMQMKAATDKAIADAWGRMGLPTKRDQERTLALLGRLESRLADIEEKVDTLV